MTITGLSHAGPAAATFAYLIPRRSAISGHRGGRRACHSGASRRLNYPGRADPLPHPIRAGSCQNPDQCIVTKSIAIRSPHRR
jgi:hypothetical protein